MPRQQFSESYLNHYFWHMHGDRTPWVPDGADKINTLYNGTITAALAGTDLDKNNRTDALVEALSDTKKVIIRLPKIVSLELRFRFNGTAGDQHVVPIFGAAGVDHYDLIETLTMDQGSQIYVAGAAGTGIDFIDTVVTGGSAKWMTNTTILSSTGDNIGRFILNRHGYDKILVAASTLDVANSGTTLYVDWKQL